MGGITPGGKLYLMVQERAYRGIDVVRFLKHLARHVSGKLLVLWDGAPIHRSQVVKEYLSHGAAQRIHLEQFPGYAPELNPAEEPLLPKHLPSQLRVAQGHRPPGAQDPGYSGLHQATRILLDVYVGISKRVARVEPES